MHGTSIESVSTTHTTFTPNPGNTMKRFLLPATSLVLLCTACKKNADTETPIPNNKALTWDKTYGGTNYEFINAQAELDGGGFIVAGATRSTDGDVVSPPRTGYDFWLAKIDGNGGKVWSKTYGNNTDEYATGVVPTADGGFLLVGHSFDNIGYYAIAVKANANGDLQWEKRISTSGLAKPFGIVSSGDGGFLVVGTERQSNGNVNGWVTKLNNDGSTAWSKNYGGSAEDQFNAIVKTNDGFVLAGQTKSDNIDLPGSNGNYDAWLLKIDAAGNKVWSKNWGGNGEDYFKGVAITSDGSIVTGGYTTSGNGDIPANKGGNEAWVMKFDGNGNKTWSKTFGGRNEEYISNIGVTTDGGLIIAGHTNSTTGDVVRVENDFGGWIVKMDGAGNKTATSTYGGRQDEFINGLITTRDGGYLISGYQDVPGRGYDGLLLKIGAL